MRCVNVFESDGLLYKVANRCIYIAQNKRDKPMNRREGQCIDVDIVRNMTFVMAPKVLHRVITLVVIQGWHYHPQFCGAVRHTH